MVLILLLLLLLLGAKNVNTPVHWGRQNNMLLLLPLLLSFLKYPSTARMPSLYRAYCCSVEAAFWMYHRLPKRY